VAADLIITVRNVVRFGEVLTRAERVLRRLVNTTSVPRLTYVLPSAKQNQDLAEHLVDLTFPGAYIRLAEAEQSSVDFATFEGSGKKLLLGCAAYGRTPASEVLAAALAAASAELMGGAVIRDDGHHWVTADECTAHEFLEKLSLSKVQADFGAGIEGVYCKLAVHRKHLDR
jgi:hypothetical protein